MLCLIYPPTVNPLIHNPALNGLLLLRMYYYNREINPDRMRYNPSASQRGSITSIYKLLHSFFFCRPAFYYFLTSDSICTSRCVHLTVHFRGSTYIPMARSSCPQPGVHWEKGVQLPPQALWLLMATSKAFFSTAIFLLS